MPVYPVVADLAGVTWKEGDLCTYHDLTLVCVSNPTILAIEPAATGVDESSV